MTGVRQFFHRKSFIDSFIILAVKRRFLHRSVGQSGFRRQRGRSAQSEITNRSRQKPPTENSVGGFSVSEKRYSAALFLKVRTFRRSVRPLYSAMLSPSARQDASASSSGASLQITLSHAKTAPSPVQRSSQLLIHSPSPQP